MADEFIKRTRHAEEQRKALHLNFRYLQNLKYYSELDNQAMTAQSLTLAYAKKTDQLKTLDAYLSLFDYAVVNFYGKEVILECLH